MSFILSHFILISQVLTIAVFLAFLPWVLRKGAKNPNFLDMPLVTIVAALALMNLAGSHFTTYTKISSRCCYLISALRFPLYEGSLGPGLSRSYLNSAVELGCSVQTLSARLLYAAAFITFWLLRTVMWFMAYRFREQGPVVGAVLVGLAAIMLLAG